MVLIDPGDWICLACELKKNIIITYQWRKVKFPERAPNIIGRMSCDCDYVLPSRKGFMPHYDNCKTVWQAKHPGKKYPKNDDGTIALPNEHLLSLDVDILYHLGLDNKNCDLKAMFHDAKFVCMGGTKYRMREFAQYMAGVLNIPTDGGLKNLTKRSQRYAMYKVGPVLAVSHGIGIPSMTTLLQEVIKLLAYAKVANPIVFRLGTSGGLGIPAGSVVVSSWGLNGNLEKTHNIPILGKTRKFPSILDTRLSQEVHSLADPSDEFQTFLGGTMGADDFYRGQGRLDGPFCDYTEQDKLAYLTKLSEMGVRNIEMEAPALAAMLTEAGVRGGVVCVTFLDRLQGDQVTPSKATLTDWQNRPMILIGRYIEKYLKK
ncbi:uridine phosphorylase 1 isoform X1 [Manduca sexta]|nr:uridine phosphorylase 1 isoform X1 [Manduca sexta]KAG6443485.1 hypothetical protein O3G_MSEX002853 [Manduca sexta]